MKGYYTTKKPIVELLQGTQSTGNNFANSRWESDFFRHSKIYSPHFAYPVIINECIVKSVYV